MKYIDKLRNILTMKYSNLIGKEVLILNNTEYLYSRWHDLTKISKFSGSCKWKISNHKICDKIGPFFGIECIYCANSQGPEYFIFPEWEFERLNLNKYLSLSSFYEIY